MPSQERCRRHDSRQLMKHTPAQFLGPDRQASALIVIEMQPLASQLLSQHAVLFLQKVDHILLSLVHPASEGNQNQPKRIMGQSHRDIVAPQSALLRAKPRCLCHSAFRGIEFLDTTTSWDAALLRAWLKAAATAESLNRLLLKD